MNRDTVGGGSLYECISEKLRKVLMVFSFILPLYNAYQSSVHKHNAALFAAATEERCIAAVP